MDRISLEKNTNIEFIYDILVSVIIPVYNVEPFIAEALDSVLNQTYSNLEILIIDDGSTDGSGEICDYYARKDGRFHVIHQENKGLSASRNVGLDRMTGDVVAFLDPDDAYCPSFIELMLNSMLCEKADLVMSKYSVNYTLGTLNKSKKPNTIPLIAEGLYNKFDILRAQANGTINCNVWNKLYRRSLWDDIRFPEGHVYEDIDTTYKIINLCQRVYVLNRSLYCYRKRPGSITDIQTPANILDKKLAYSHYIAFVESHIPDIYTSEDLKRIQVTQLQGLIRDYLLTSDSANGQRIVFKKYLRKQALNIGQEVETNMLALRIRVSYYMLCFCPGLLKAVYPIYRFIRVMILKITIR